MNKKDIVKDVFLREIEGGNFHADTLFARTIFEIIKNDISLEPKEYTDVLSLIMENASEYRKQLDQIKKTNTSLWGFINFGASGMCVYLRGVSRELNILLEKNDMLDRSLVIDMKIQKTSDLLANLEMMKGSLTQSVMI